MNTVKMKRLDLRITGEGKTLIERAAQLKHTTISAYMLESARQKAREEIDSLERIHLQDTEWDVFYAALVNPIDNKFFTNYILPLTKLQTGATSHKLLANLIIHRI
jgi:uncharacterized protein (DUF1778 family)